MEHIPLQSNPAAFVPAQTVTTFSPLKLGPLYGTSNFPPELFLHPYTNALTPLCSTCIGKLSRTSDITHIICRCQDDLDFRLEVPVTAVFNLYPLATEIKADLVRSTNAVELLVITYRDIKSDTASALDKAMPSMAAETKKVLAEKTTMVFREALRDRPQNQPFRTAEALCVAATAHGMIDYAHRRAASNEEPMPRSLITPLKQFANFSKPTLALALHVAAKSVMQGDDFLAHIKSFQAAAEHLVPAAHQAESTCLLLSQALPYKWTHHKLHKDKHWMHHQPSYATVVYFRTQINMLNQNPPWGQAPDTAYAKKLLPFALNVLLVLARTTARIMRLDFEFQAAWAAARIWKEDMVMLLDPTDTLDPRNPGALGALPRPPGWDEPGPSAPPQQSQGQSSLTGKHPAPGPSSNEAPAKRPNLTLDSLKPLAATPLYPQLASGEQIQGQRQMPPPPGSSAASLPPAAPSTGGTAFTKQQSGSMSPITEEELMAISPEGTPSREAKKNNPKPKAPTKPDTPAPNAEPLNWPPARDSATPRTPSSPFNLSSLASHIPFLGQRLSSTQDSVLKKPGVKKPSLHHVSFNSVVMAAFLVLSSLTIASAFPLPQSERLAMQAAEAVSDATAAINPMLAQVPPPTDDTKEDFDLEITTTEQVPHTDSGTIATKSGMFQRNGFLYVNQGRRTLNPHTKTVTRKIETNSLRVIGPTMIDIVANLRKICEATESTFEATTTTKMETAPTATSHIGYFDACARKGMQPAMVSSRAEVDALKKLMIKKNLTAMVAPVQYTPDGIRYITGHNINTAYFNNGINGTVMLKELKLPDANKVTRSDILFRYEFQHDTLMLKVYDCHGWNRKSNYACRDTSAPLACQSVRLEFWDPEEKQTHTMPHCGTNLVRMQQEAEDISNMITKTLPQAFSNGGYASGDKPQSADKSPPTLTQSWSNSSPHRPKRQGSRMDPLPMEDWPRMEDNINDSTTPTANATQANQDYIAKDRDTRALATFTVIGTAVVSTLMSLSSLIQSGITDARSSNVSGDQQQILATLRDNTLTNEAQDSEIREIAKFVTANAAEIGKQFRFLWFRTQANELVNRFRFLTNVANIGLNKLANCVLACQVGKVNPALLTQSELAATAVQVSFRDNIQLSRNIEDVVPHLYLQESILMVAFTIPVQDPSREFDFFEIKPVPFFRNDSGTVTKAIASNVPRFVAFHVHTDGFVTPEPNEAFNCLMSDNVCHTSQPVQPAHQAGCGVAPFLHEQAECVYEEAADIQNFYHTVGNFTCYSVKEPITVKAQCLTADMHVQSTTRMQLDVTAGCFTFSDSCSLRTDDGSMILTYSPSGTPFSMSSIVKLSPVGYNHDETTITDNIPVNSRYPEISQVLAIAHGDDPRKATIIPVGPQPPPLYNTFVVPGMLLSSVTLMVIVSCMCYARRQAVKYKRVAMGHADDIAHYRDAFDSLKQRLHSFRGSINSLASAASRSSSRFPSRAASPELPPPPPMPLLQSFNGR